MITIHENDGFIYANISELNENILIDNIGVIYEQFEGNDDEICESLIQDSETLKNILNNNGVIVYEMGEKQTLLSDYLEAKERNNENRSFDAWIMDKAENLF